MRWRAYDEAIPPTKLSGDVDRARECFGAADSAADGPLQRSLIRTLHEPQRLPRRLALEVARAWMGLRPRLASRAVESENSEAVIADRETVCASFA